MQRGTKDRVSGNTNIEREGRRTGDQKTADGPMEAKKKVSKKNYLIVSLDANIQLR